MSEHSLARLFVLCSRPAPGPGAGEEVLRLAGSVRDWNRAIGKAEEEGILPLLYWNLRDHPGAVPAAVLETLRRAFLRNLARTAQVYRDLELFLSSVRRAGLRAALTKGGRLALDLYPEPALRPFWDVDFIVHPADWPALKKILGDIGYTEAADSGGGPAAADPPLDWTYSPYYRKDSLFLEFHFTPLGLHFPNREGDGLWSSASRLNVRGTEAMILPAEHELCYLCIHAQQHSYQRLIWLSDIAELSLRPGLDWDRVLRISQADRVRGPVFYGLHLANALWPGTVPPGPLAGLRPGFFERAGLSILWPAASTTARRTAPPWPYYMPSLFSLWERKSPGLAVRTLRGILFPPRAWLAVSCGLPSNSLRLYGRYFDRILRPLLTAAKRFTAAP
ncbi:MAG: nucleotidyltransferase family protein [Candidatus Aminicenantes bacterium]|nr:nucleotidyltransferase family protein [Candidatus Aminicenantes bacterium]